MMRLHKYNQLKKLISKFKHAQYRVYNLYHDQGKIDEKYYLKKPTVY